MWIYYDEGGAIIEVAADQVDRDGACIEVRDNKIPDDLLTTFPLGKYRVTNGKLATRRSFQLPAEVPLSAFLSETVAALAAGKRRRPRRARARGAPAPESA